MVVFRPCDLPFPQVSGLAMCPTGAWMCPLTFIQTSRHSRSSQSQQNWIGLPAASVTSATLDV